MAVAVGEVQLTCTTKVPLGGNRALYVGTAQGGTEYPTGGAAIGEEATNQRFKPPEKWDYLHVDTLGLLSQFISPNKLKLLAETTVATSTETPLSELKSKATMATAIPAGTPFYGIGIG